MPTALLVNNLQQQAAVLKTDNDNLQVMSGSLAVLAARSFQRCGQNMVAGCAAGSVNEYNTLLLTGPGIHFRSGPSSAPSPALFP